MPVVSMPLVTARGNARVVSSPEPPRWNRAWDPREHVGHLRVGAEVGEQAVAHPAANLLTVDHHEADRLARRQCGPRETIPLGAAARERPNVPLDPGVLRLEVVEDLLEGRLRGRIATAREERDRTGQIAPEARIGLEPELRPGAPHAATSGASRGAGCDGGAELQNIPATEHLDAIRRPFVGLSRSVSRCSR